MNFSIKLPDYIPKKLAIGLVIFLVVCVAGAGFWKMVSDEIQEYVGVSQQSEPSIIPFRYTETKLTNEITERIQVHPANISGD